MKRSVSVFDTTGHCPMTATNCAVKLVDTIVCNPSNVSVTRNDDNAQQFDEILYSSAFKGPNSGDPIKIS